MGRKRKRSKAASPVKFSKKVVVAILAEVTVFTVAMVAVYMKTGGGRRTPSSSPSSPSSEGRPECSA